MIYAYSALVAVTGIFTRQFDSMVGLWEHPVEAVDVLVTLSPKPDACGV